MLPAGGGGPGRPARRHQPAGPGQRGRTLYSRHGRPLGQRPHAAGRQQFQIFAILFSVSDPDWIRIRTRIQNPDPDPGGQK